MTTRPPTPNAPAWIETLRWNDDGLIPAVVQDSTTGAVLMFAWMNREALVRSLATGQTHFYSRSRQALWHKGATSGHVQEIIELRVDCDADVLLVRVRQHGGACHEGYTSCFFRKLDGDRLIVDADRRFDPASVYL
jgi:phosphoribosyl-AMP cyclohydrolase